MKIGINRVIVFMLSTVLRMPFFVNASWQSEACSLNHTGCATASSGFKVPYCVTTSVDYAEACIWPALTNNLSSMPDQKKSLSSFDIKDLLGQYCESLLGKGADWRVYYAKPSQVSDSWDWQQTFDSHQSLFVYALCSSFKDKDWNALFVPEWGDILSEAFVEWELVDILKLHQRGWWKDLCSLSDSMNLSDCDMSIYATEIFTAIMSDIFKIKYAQVLQVNTVKNFEAKTPERVQDFFKGYYYIIQKYQELKKLFPQTVEVLESNQEYYKNVLDTVKVMDNSKFAELAEGSGCPITGNMVWMDFIACALHSTQWKWMAIEPAFETMFYNELLNYRIFLNYHSLWIEDKVDGMAVNKDNEKNIRIYESRAPDFQFYWDIQLDSAKFALRRFEDFAMTYPLHIWLLLYQERVKEYRDKYLSPIVTIFYSLSEKLQNVQLPN